MTGRSIAIAAVVALAVAAGVGDHDGIMPARLASLAPLAPVLVPALVPVAHAAESPASQHPSPLPSDNAAATLHRGAELAAIGDCAVCHTASHGAPFAGGRPLDTPFGTIWSTNITPDRDTGIGAWSLDAFTRAMRRGMSRDGHLLYPAFPYPHFTHMTDADIAAVYAFLMSRDPVRATPPANRLVFPLGFRPLIAGWNLFFLHRGVEPNGDAAADFAAGASAAASSDAVELERGRYLVDGPGHCAACHTPLNLLGAEQRGHALSGAVIEGWQAPSLTALLSAPKPWTRDQLVAYLRTGFASDHGAAAGPMRPVTQSLADASARDVTAMADYLMSLQMTPAAAGAVPASSPSQQHASAEAEAEAEANVNANGHADAVTARVQNGATLFNGACAQCHAPHAPMTTLGNRPSLALGSASNANTPRNVLRAMLDGIRAQPGASGPSMPAFRNVFTDAQIADLAAFLRARFSSQPAWSVDEASVAKLRKEAGNP
ncbi:cytochrome c [Paraburkholderia phosphatilytica]|uniref:cytochrome c n=1 Tax=Paraburkholderia phosphatilytica TaxID=2282883 RepID=UPI0030B862F8